MSKQSTLTIILASLLLQSCSDETKGMDCSQCPSNSPQCEACEECQQCPTCKEGDECPACPSLNCPTCPTCKEGDECPTCNTDVLNSQLTSCNNELTTTKQALKTEQEANESCSDSLDSCNNDLITAKARTLSKNGSRLKVYTYYGVDGSQVVTQNMFDSKLDQKCAIFDATQYGCNNKIYCIPYNTSYISESYISDSITENNYYYSCSSAYDSADSIIISYFGEGNMISKSTSASIRKYTNSAYYLNPSCTTQLSNNYVIDAECEVKKDDILREYTYYSEPSDSHLCIDNSTYAGTVTKYRYVYYKPLTASFSTLYEKSGNSCRKVEENVILLQQIDEINPTIEDARANRETYCKNFCQAIEEEAVSKDWVKMELKTIDYE